MVCLYKQLDNCFFKTGIHRAVISFQFLLPVHSSVNLKLVIKKKVVVLQRFNNVP
jgi:hypothetical protein